MISPHPLYDDEVLVKEVSQAHLDAGRSVFQLYMIDPDEYQHSRIILKCLELPLAADILSLGCGVGGMEAHWKAMRPDLDFTLVNSSKAQLDLCKCPGKRVHERAEDYLPCPYHPDVTLISYALGHMDARVVLERALEYTRGPVVVLDVFDGTDEFNETFAYNSPKSELMTELGFSLLLDTGWVINPFITKSGLEHTAQQSLPYLWISE
jgi:SAM-dependent methyltransferase